MTTVDDLLNIPPDPRPQPKRNRYGQYLIEGKAYVRATTIADTLDDRYNLEKWGRRMVAKGLANRADLHALASTLDTDRDKAELNKLCDQAIEAAKTLDKAGLGTALHRMTEAVDGGANIDTVPAVWRPHIDAYTSALAQHGIQIDRDGIERILVYGNPDAQTRIAGTADRLPVTWHGRRYVADLKTGANLAWSWNAIAIQMAVYAFHNHTYDPVTDQLGPRVDVETDKAIVIHLPAVLEGQVKPRCDLYMVDIAAGHDALMTALEVREWRKSKNLAIPFGAIHIDGTPADTPAWFKERGQAIAAVPAALEQLRRLWPSSVPQPLPPTLTDSQTADLDRAMSVVETNHQIPFTRQQPGVVKQATKTKSKDKAA